MSPRIANLFKGLLIVVVVLAVFIPTFTYIIFPQMVRWGVTDDEIAQTFPGDELVAESAVAFTTNDAITIQATPAQIYPWLVQLGALRGGLYSYTWLEEIIACHNDNADRIHSEWQNPQPEDLVRMCPNFGPPPYILAYALTDQAFVIGHHPPGGAQPHQYDLVGVYRTDGVYHGTRLAVGGEDTR